MAKGNALQAVLDRANAKSLPSGAATSPDVSAPKSANAGRQGTKLIGGHFAPEVSVQLRILAAEEGSTVQSLLAEALNDLFVKKGKNRVAGIV